MSFSRFIARLIRGGPCGEDGAPGVTQDPRGLTSSSNGDLAFGGMRGYQSSYLVDGADNRFVRGIAHVELAFVPEIIAHVKSLLAAGR